MSARMNQEQQKVTLPTNHAFLIRGQESALCLLFPLLNTHLLKNLFLSEPPFRSNSCSSPILFSKCGDFHGTNATSERASHLLAI